MACPYIAPCAPPCGITYDPLCPLPCRQLLGKARVDTLLKGLQGIQRPGLPSLALSSASMHSLVSTCLTLH